MEKIIIDEKTENQRLDKFLKRYFPSAKSGFLYKMLRKKNIVVNEKKTRGDYILESGDEVDIYFSDDTVRRFKVCINKIYEPSRLIQSLDFKKLIIFENSQIIIINKPAGLLSQKAKEKDISVCELLINYLFESGQINDESLGLYRPSVVNRLDRNTSGAMICSKSLLASRVLGGMLKNRSIHKEYLALVSGIIEGKQYHTDYLKKNKENNLVEISGTKKDGYEKIETFYIPVGYLKNNTLLKVLLITGKTHQIRAHLAYLGHPLCGDPKYNAGKKNFGLKRQFLHSYIIGFPDCGGVLSDISGKRFTADLSPDLKKVERFIEYKFPCT